MKSFPFERWPDFDAVFARALELEGDDRSAYLDQACSDAQMRAEVDALLGAEARSRRLFGDGTPPPWALTGFTLPDVPDEMSGRVVGAYRLQEIIGQGGTSTVYRAERSDGVFQHSVAVKILDPSLMGREARARFRQERQILAALEHPNIARLIDGGISEEGWPYFVMELVEGEPIDQYCDQRRLSVRDRLDLFLPVCRAVQYAHGNLIVHRDLKPGNILVTGEGQVKLLDFGIAKLLATGEWSGDAVETRTGVIPMTPAYAAPEQIDGGAVTTATDVYQLGEVLHLLLTGHRAFEGESGWAAMLSRLNRDAPRTPSTWVTRPIDSHGSEAGAPPRTANDIAELRQTSVGRLKRDLAGDLDTLVVTAMRTNPQRRYESAEAMAQDIERYLHGMPLLAHPDSVAYRSAKFFRRHPLATAGTAVATVALLILAGQLTREYRRAEVEREKAAAVTDFVVGLFQRTDPGAAASDTLTALALLQEGAGRIGDELGDQPRVQAAVMAAVGRAYMGLGRYDEAEELFSVALEQRRALLPSDHPDLFASLVDMGGLRFVRSELDEAERLFQEALAVSRSSYGEETRESAHVLGQLALVSQQRGEVEAALAQYEEALGTFRRAGPLGLDAAVVLVNLGWLHSRQQNWDDGEAALREALELRNEILGEDHAAVGSALAALSNLELRAGRLDSAVVHVGRSLEIMERVHGPESVQLSDPLIAMGGALVRARRYAEAEAAYRRALALVAGEFGEASPNTARIHNDLGNIVRDAGRLEEAEEQHRAALRGYALGMGGNHYFTGIALHNLAQTLAAQGRAAEAEDLLARALGIFEAQGFGTSTSMARSLALLGSLKVEAGQALVADTVLRRALAIWDSADPQDPIQLANTQAQLGRALHLMGRWPESESHLHEAHTVMREIGSDEHPATRRVAEWLAELHEASGQADVPGHYRQLAGN